MKERESGGETRIHTETITCIYTNTQIMQTATANNINFTNSAARNAPDEQQQSTKRACRRREERKRRRRRQNDDNEGVWHQRRIEMLTQLHLLMHECVCVCIDKYAST